MDDFNENQSEAQCLLSPEESAKLAKDLQADTRKSFIGRLRGGETERGGKKEKETQATQLVMLVEQAGCELFRDGNHDAFVTIPVDGRRETWPLRRKGFKQWMAFQFFCTYQKSPGSQGLNDALNTLEGKALFECPEYPVHVRMAGDQENIFIDLGGPEWNMIHITSAGWSVVPHGDVKFIRGNGTQPLPVPIGGGDLAALIKPFFNLQRSHDAVLMIGVMVDMIRAYGPHFLLELNGEQGAAKTTAARIIKRTLDPSSSDSRCEPREPRDLMIWARSNWIISLENLSHIAPWLSDALCRLATGGGFSTRQLYSDSDEVIFEALRPVIVNGISSLATKPDLIDRSIIIELAPITPDRRKPEAEIWSQFNEAHPHILGALCDVAACCLKHLPSTKLDGLERMADSVLWVTAGEKALKWKSGTFQNAYRQNREAANTIALESSVLYEPLRDFIQGQPGKTWTGLCSELLAELRDQCPEQAKRRDWPSTPRKLRGLLTRLAPNLRNERILVTFHRKERDGAKVSLDWVAEQQSQRSQRSQAAPDKGFRVTV